MQDEVALLVAHRRRQMAIEDLIQKASERLNVFARNLFTPSVWEIRARQRAAEAVGRLRQDAPLAEITAVTQQAGAEVEAEYQAEKQKMRNG